MKRKDIMTKIHFVEAVGDISNWYFFVLFLEGEPLMHILHSESALLVFTIMGRFLKWELYAELTAKWFCRNRI